MRCLLVALALTLLAPTAPAAALPDGASPGPLASTSVRAAATTGPAEAPARVVPGLRVTRTIGGLDRAWDVQPIGRKRLLVTERDTARLYVWKDGRKHRVRFPSDTVWTSDETGLMSLALDPRFATTGRFYTCQGGTTGSGRHDIRVVAWRLDDAATRARKIERVVGGLPTRTGRHGGCRIIILDSGAMLVGTGDAAQGTNPRNLRSLGGKTLRLDPRTGAPWPTNPFIRSDHRRTRYVFTYGHRNVQGLGQRRDGSLWSVEQGSYRDDEVNRLVRGGDYGWNPVPGYNEDVPMTDHSLPGRQRAARWRSGTPTLASSGGSWVYGRQWGALAGTFAVAMLKAERVLFLTFDRRGRLQRVRAPEALRRYGRLRSITQAPGGALLITTDNGGGRDVVLRVRPRR